MLSRENSVLAVAFALCLAAFLLGAALGLEGPIYAFVVVIAIPIVGPQLYLAATGDEAVPAPTRIRTALLLGGGLCLLFGTAGTDAERRLFWGIGTGLLLTALVYEVRTGYLREIASR
ncbi:hypothetical protein C478_15252 [Natrinema thermotolerans DSM 11552]|nr:hypothetical protein C478_15252 [Natrinema thermotolerans DSM 11552]